MNRYRKFPVLRTRLIFFISFQFVCLAIKMKTPGFSEVSTPCYVVWPERDTMANGLISVESQYVFWLAILKSTPIWSLGWLVLRGFVFKMWVGFLKWQILCWSERVIRYWRQMYSVQNISLLYYPYLSLNIQVSVPTKTESRTQEFLPSFPFKTFVYYRYVIFLMAVIEYFPLTFKIIIFAITINTSPKVFILMSFLARRKVK